MAKKIQYICDGCGLTDIKEAGEPTPDWYSPIWVKVGTEDRTLFEAAYNLNLCTACKRELNRRVSVDTRSRTSTLRNYTGPLRDCGPDGPEPRVSGVDPVTGKLY